MPSRSEPCRSEWLEAAADRLANSVIHPLSEATGGDRLDAGEGAPADRTPVAAEWEQALWELTRRATDLRVKLGQPDELLEATAALQDLARSVAADDQVRGTPPEALAELQAELVSTIRPEKNGPYLVTNPGRLEDWLGTPVETTAQMALCRCGQSKIKPLCDGTHRRTDFATRKTRCGSSTVATPMWATSHNPR